MSKRTKAEMAIDYADTTINRGGPGWRAYVAAKGSADNLTMYIHTDLDGKPLWMSSSSKKVKTADDLEALRETMIRDGMRVIHVETLSRWPNFQTREYYLTREQSERRCGITLERIAEWRAREAEAALKPTVKPAA